MKRTIKTSMAVNFEDQIRERYLEVQKGREREKLQHRVHWAFLHKGRPEDCNKSSCLDAREVDEKNEKGEIS